MHQAAIYVRINIRSDEVRERRAIEARMARCLQFAREQGYAVSDAHIYQDIASGLTKEREGLNRLRKALPEIEVLIIDDFSQLSRNQLMLELFLRECEKTGVRVVSVAASPASYRWNEGRNAFESVPEEASLIQKLFEEYQEP